MPIQSLRPNQERNTAAAPVRKPLTLTITLRPSNAKAAQVRIFFSFPANSSRSKQAMNCAPPLL